MRFALLVALLTGCAGATGLAGTALPVSAFRPEDRVVIGNWSQVNAVAASVDRVFVAYPTAVGIWRPLERKWEVPRTPPSPAMLAEVFSAVIDPADQSVWFATPTGWVHYVPGSEQWSSSLLPGRVLGIASDNTAGFGAVWFRTDRGWLEQPRTGGPAIAATPPVSLVQPPTIDDAMRDLPQLRALAPRFLTGARMTRGSFTAAAPSPTGTGWFLGTSNRGLLFIDQMASEPTLLSQGLPGDFVHALALLADGIWVETDATAYVPSAVTFLRGDLAGSVPLASTPALGLPFDMALRIVLGERVLWLATDHGLVRASVDGPDLKRWDVGQGLPNQEVLSLTQLRGAIVAGTLRGLVDVGADGTLLRRARHFVGPAYALAANADTLWVGTDGGLFASLPGDDDLRMPEGYRIAAVGEGAVLGVGYLADTLMAMTRRSVYWRDPVSGAWTPSPAIPAALGQLTTLSTGTDGAWLGGTSGAGLLRPRLGVIRTLVQGSDLPGAVTAIASDASWLWVGTTAGLVRFRLEGR